MTVSTTGNGFLAMTIDEFSYNIPATFSMDGSFGSSADSGTATLSNSLPATKKDLVFMTVNPGTDSGPWSPSGGASLAPFSASIIIGTNLALHQNIISMLCQALIQH